MSIDFIKSIYYEFISYFIPKKIRYKTEGSCIKCGQCCKNILSPGLKNEKELKFMQIIFPHYRYFYISGRDINNELILSCKKLKEDNTCSIYRYRPLICRNYPPKHLSKYHRMPEHCGFKLTEKSFKDYL